MIRHWTAIGACLATLSGSSAGITAGLTERLKALEAEQLPTTEQFHWVVSTADSVFDIHGQGPHRTVLRRGWSCTIRLWPPSIRYTTCSLGEVAVEFTTRCETTRPRDFTEIRLHLPDQTSSEPIDYISVGCYQKADH